MIIDSYQRSILNHIDTNPYTPISVLQELFPHSANTIRSLVSRGFLALTQTVNKLALPGYYLTTPGKSFLNDPLSHPIPGAIYHPTQE